MVVTDQNLIQRLSEENPRFRKLHEEHVLFEKKLQEYEEQAYLSEAADIERKKVQKLKLAGKDEMEAMLRDFRQ